MKIYAYKCKYVALKCICKERHATHCMEGKSGAQQALASLAGGKQVAESGKIVQAGQVYQLCTVPSAFTLSCPF